MESLRAAAVQCSAAGAGGVLEQAGSRLPPQLSLESSMRGQQCARLGLERKALSGSRAFASTRQRGGRPGAVRAMAADGEVPSSGSSGGFSSSSPQSSPAAGKTRSVATGAGGPSPTMIRSDPRHEKLMKMQKELLEQLEERRKLHAALLQSLDDPASTIKEFNESTRGGLPPVGPLSAAPSQKAQAAAPPQASAVSARPPAKAAVAPPAPAASVAAPSRQAAAPAVTPAPARAPAQVKPATSPISVPIPSAPSRQRPAASPAPAAAAPPAAAPAAAPAPAPAPTAPPAKASTPPPPAPFAAPPRVAPKAAAAPASPVAPPKAAAAPAVAPPAPKPAPAAPKVAPPAPVITPKVEPKVTKGPVFKAPPAAAPAFVAEKAVEKPKVEVVKAAPAEPPVEEKPPPLAGANVMNIVMVASECAPWSKTGGLGDVVGALPKALARRGHRVMVCVPRYGNYPEAVDMSVRKRYNVAGQDLEVGYFHHYRDGVDFVFIDNNMFHHHEKNIYGGSREEVAKRMILLCKAAIEAPWHAPCGGVCYGDGNLVFIANDWHTALLPVYLQAYYRDHGLMQFTRSVLVIHNMAHQGRGPVAEYPWLGLPDHYLDRFKLYDPIGGEHMNVFMAGIISAHKIVAVSHGYAWEIQTQMGGWGLDAVLRDHNQKLRGVVNGIDVQEWSPECDPHLLSDGYVQYSMDTLDDKAKCKAALQRELGLPERPDVPLLGFIGRLDYQKGVDIIGEAMPWITSQDCQVVLLGTGRADLEDMLRQFEGSHREKVRGWVGFSVKMAHRITAGADILLMPSRFEPCGLNQLYAMRYGTVPVVHAVGGLRDTVQAFDPFNDAGLGWTFDKAEANGLIHALGNCMYTYKEFKDSWKKLQLRGMSQDLSWDNAAAQYEEVLVQAKYIW